jgi:hypothetical protein
MLNILIYLVISKVYMCLDVLVDVDVDVDVAASQ